jgi:hypothetical protein
MLRQLYKDKVLFKWIGNVRSGGCHAYCSNSTAQQCVHPIPDKVHRGHGGGAAVVGRFAVRVFTCACGKVQAGSLHGSRLVPSKWHCPVPPMLRDG